MQKVISFLFIFIFLIGLASSVTFDNIAYYKLDESSGAILDSTPYAKNGVNGGATQNVSGKINTAYDLEHTEQDYLRVNDTGGFDNVANLSINLWLKSESQTPGNIIFTKQTAGTANSYYCQWDVGGTINCGFNTAGGYATASTNKSVVNSQWTMFTTTFSNGSLKLYLNGSLVGNGSVASSTILNTADWFTIGADNLANGSVFDTTYDGVVDEIGVWNRTLSVSEITDLYNSGSGLSYTTVSPATITLNSPLNNTYISDIGTIFNISGGSVSSYNANWTNATITIYDNASNIHNRTTIVGLTNNTFNQTLFIDYFTLGNYTWNVSACYSNSTGAYYVNSSTYKFIVIPFSTLGVSYPTSVLEGSTYNYSINLSILSTERMSTVNFYYNSTSYSVVPIEYETNKYYLSKEFSVPLVNANSNVSFYWEVSLESGFKQNTDVYNQTILNLSLDNCSSYTVKLFNFTLVDEDDQTILNGASYNTSIKINFVIYSLDRSLNIINFSRSYQKINPVSICSNYNLSSSEYLLDGLVEYSSVDRFKEFVNYQSFVLSNQSNNVTLYNLLTSRGEEFKIVYKGEDFIPVKDLIIQVQRKYVDEGIYKTIEIPSVGSGGYTIGHLVPNEVLYNLIFIKDGTILDSFIDVIAECQNPSFNDCKITLNSVSGGDDLIGLVEENDFYSTLLYDETTHVVSSNFGILSGVSSKVDLNVYLYDNYGNRSVCSDTLISAGGTLLCTVPESYGNSTIYATIIYDGKTRRAGIISRAIKPNDLYGGALIFSALIVILFILGIGISDNPLVMGLCLILGLIVLVALNLVYTPSMVGVGATVLWFFIAIMIIIFKGGQKR